ncbi:MAG: 3-oxoacyl-ACP reductase FabG [Thermicanus sp.]|nr:3-oxoacyl-ACP reductase FabG [Thermicanus sp.]
MGVRGRVAVITGGASGIGLAAVKRFAHEGAKVVIADYNEEAGREAEKTVRETGGEAVFFPVDVSDRESVDRMVECALEKYGQIDILINNAGITQDAMLHKMTTEQWERVLAINLSGVFHCTQAVVRHMRERGYGRIINTSSVVGKFGNVGQTNYAATKAGVIGMTQTWAKELGRKGITVNAVAPGFIRTPMTAKMPEKILGMMEEKVNVGRLGEPEDVAHAYLFLASDEASYINGIVLSVDGGLSL